MLCPGTTVALALAPAGSSFAKTPFAGALVDPMIVVLNLGYAVAGVVLMWVAYRVFDRLTPEVDFAAELKNGNVAVAIFIAALFISIALIVARALN